MADSSLVPERQLVFSPGLAATLGLEEAVLLQHLDAARDLAACEQSGSVVWWSLSWDYLLRSLPFWDRADIQRVATNLQEQGVLTLAPTGTAPEGLVFAFDVEAPADSMGASDPSAHSTSSAPPTGFAPSPRASAGGNPSAPDSAAPEHAQAPAPRRGATRLAADWKPGEALLHLLTVHQNIPREFALEQLEDFVFYWRERGDASHAWENKFRQHVTSNWRRHQQQRAEVFREEPPPLDKHWRPSADALEILERDEVDAAFIEQAIPEFVLYWRERGAAPRELNSRFLQHIRIQWARYTSSLSHSTEPRRIAADWEPSEDVYDILRLSYIDADFARALLPEFIIFWRDSNQVHTSWNSKFLQHVKYHWAKRHKMGEPGQGHGGQQAHRTGRTRDRSLEDDLTDTSWAE